MPSGRGQPAGVASLEPSSTLDERLQWFADQVRPDLERRFSTGDPDPNAVHLLANAGLLGLTLPPRLGGLGQDYSALGAASEGLGRIDLSFQISLTVHLALAAMTILQWGSELQRQQWLPALAEGPEIATFALTEPGAGSDVAALTTRGVRDGSGYRLTGEKTWISGANDSTLLLVFATVDPTLRHKGVTAFVVGRASDGLSTPTLTGKLGIRAGDTGSVVLDNVWVPDANVLGEVGGGFPIALSALGNGLLTVGYGALGIISECLSLSIGLLHRAADASRSPGQLARQEIAMMSRHEAVARQLLQQASDRKNLGLPSQQQTGLAKWTAAEGAVATAQAALRLAQEHGDAALPTIERHLRNAKGAVIYGGTTQIHQSMQGAYALGNRYDRPMDRPPLTSRELTGAHEGEAN